MFNNEIIYIAIKQSSRYRDEKLSGDYLHACRIVILINLT
jgi:hypothetical protein